MSDKESKHYCSKKEIVGKKIVTLQDAIYELHTFSEEIYSATLSLSKEIEGDRQCYNEFKELDVVIDRLENLKKFFEKYCKENDIDIGDHTELWERGTFCQDCGGRNGFVDCDEKGNKHD